MNGSRISTSVLAAWVLAALCLSGCPAPKSDRGAAEPGSTNGTVAKPEAQRSQRVATASAEDVTAAIEILDRLGRNTHVIAPGNLLTEIEILDGSAMTADDIVTLGRLTDLETLRILNYRSLNDEMAAQLAGLKNLKTLAVTNSVIGDATVELIVTSFPQLKNLDLSYNTNMTNGAMKIICTLDQLERLSLIQCRFNDLGTSHLAKLQNLRLLDLRGNMEAGDLTMETVGTLPKLAALKHRSTTVTDYGMECLAQNQTLSSLLMQDFGVTSQAGQEIAKLGTLKELEIFRCQGLGSDGVLALKGMNLERLKLRDLPSVDDRAMEVFQDLPHLQRLYLHELDSISDAGLQNLEALKSLEVLDIWSISQMTDATVDRIATLPQLKELSIRTTSVSDAAVDKILAMPELQSLVIKDNGMVTDEALQRLSGRKWTKLDIGSAGTAN